MSKQLVLSFFIAFLTISTGYCQSKKVIVKNGIISQTTHEYFIGDGLKDPVIEKFERYDSLGNVIELKEFNKRGELKRWEVYRYDGDENLVEQIIKGEDGAMQEQIIFIFQDGLLTEKQYFDRRSRLEKRKVYSYEYQ